MKHIMCTCLAMLALLRTSSAQPANHADLVADIKHRIESTIDLSHGPGECGRFEVTKRVVWTLRSEGAGFLAKFGAQNKCNGQNTTDEPGVGVDIVMYPDGTIVDILGGGHEGPNTPQWNVGTPVMPTLWRPPFDPGDGSVPPSDPPPALPLTDPILARLAALQIHFDTAVATVVERQLHEEDRAEQTFQELHLQIITVANNLEAHRVAERAFKDRVVGFLKDPKTIATILGILAGKFVLPGE